VLYTQIIKYLCKGGGIAASLIYIMSLKILVIISLVFMSKLGNSQVILSGYLYEESSSSILIGAVV